MLEAELAAREDPKTQIQRLKDELRETTEELSVANLQIQKLTNQMQIQSNHINKKPISKSNANTCQSLDPSDSQPFQKANRHHDARNTAYPTETSHSSRFIKTNSSLETPSLSSSRSLRKIHGMLNQMKLLESRVATFKSSLPLPATPNSGVVSRYGNTQQADQTPRATSPIRQTLPRSNSGQQLDSIRRHERHRSRGPVAQGGPNNSNIPVLKVGPTHSTPTTDNDEFESDSGDEYHPNLQQHTYKNILNPKSTGSQDHHDNKFPPSPRKTPEHNEEATELDVPDRDCRHFSSIKQHRLGTDAPAEYEKENRYSSDASKLSRPPSALRAASRSSSRSAQRSNHERASSSVSSTSRMFGDTPVSKYFRGSTMSVDLGAGAAYQDAASSTPRARPLRGRSVSRDLTAKPSSSLGFYTPTKSNRSSVDLQNTPFGQNPALLSRQVGGNTNFSEAHAYHRHIQNQNPGPGYHDGHDKQALKMPNFGKVRTRQGEPADHPNDGPSRPASTKPGTDTAPYRSSSALDKYKHVQRPPSRGAHTSRHSPNMYTHHTASASSLLLAAQPVPSHPKNKYGSLGQNFGAPKPRSLSSTLHRPSHSLGFTG